MKGGGRLTSIRTTLGASDGQLAQFVSSEMPLRPRGSPNPDHPGGKGGGIAIFEPGDLVFFAGINLVVVNGDGGGFVEVAHEAVGFDFGAVGVPDEAGHFEDFTFFWGELPPKRRWRG